MTQHTIILWQIFIDGMAPSLPQAVVRGREKLYNFWTPKFGVLHVFVITGTPDTRVFL